MTYTDQLALDGMAATPAEDADQLDIFDALNPTEGA